MRTDTKERMIKAAAELMRERGLSGMSFSEVMARADAPRGVIYHHFPGGKEQLAQAAVEWTGQQAATAFGALPPDACTPEDVIDVFLTAVRPIVLQSAQGAGCAVAAAVAECAHPGTMQQAADSALTDWRAVLAGRLRQAGQEADTASATATLLITVLEGSHVLCRAARDIAPFDQAANALRPTPSARR